MRVAFMGTPDFAVPTLRALAQTHEIAAVYTQPPRPAGRGRKPRPSPVQVAAQALRLEVRTPLNFRDELDRAAFAALDLDAAVVVAYGLILPVAVLEAPRHGCWNLHASLLPRWRGAAPIHRAVMAGDAESGVCVMRMEKGLDTGPVAMRARAELTARETTGSLHDRLAALGAPLMASAMNQLARDGALEIVAQDHDAATYAAKIDKAEARIDWRRPAAEIDRLIRGLTPFPGAFTEVAGERLKILAATPEAGEGPPGVALDDRLLIACGKRALRLERVQRPGRAMMDGAALLRGFPLERGTILG